MARDTAIQDDFTDLIGYARFLDADPADVAEDECREKLPATDLNPATSTAHNNQIPQTTIKLAAVAGRRGSR